MDNEIETTATPADQSFMPEAMPAASVEAIGPAPVVLPDAVSAPAADVVSSVAAGEAPEITPLSAIPTGDEQMLDETIAEPAGMSFEDAKVLMEAGTKMRCHDWPEGVWMTVARIGNTMFWALPVDHAPMSWIPTSGWEIVE